MGDACMLGWLLALIGIAGLAFIIGVCVGTSLPEKHDDSGGRSDD